MAHGQGSAPASTAPGYRCLRLALSSWSRAWADVSLPVFTYELVVGDPALLFRSTPTQDAQHVAPCLGGPQPGQFLVITPSGPLMPFDDPAADCGLGGGGVSAAAACGNSPWSPCTSRVLPAEPDALAASAPLPTPPSSRTSPAWSASAPVGPREPRRLQSGYAPEPVPQARDASSSRRLAPAGRTASMASLPAGSARHAGGSPLTRHRARLAG